MATSIKVVSNFLTSFGDCGCAININKGHATKLKALLLVVLLAGHEGVRVSISAPDTASRSALEEQWTKENSEHCVWSLGGCVGRAGEACKYRPFVLDRGPSCRLRASYVLQDKNLTEAWLKLEMDLLTESANRFENKCDGNLGAFQARVCLRRLGHIIRALNFLVRVQRTEVLRSEHGRAIWSHIDKAAKVLSSVLKNSKDDYVDLMNKVKLNAVELAKEPLSSTGWISDTVKKLASSSETERTEGRDRVAELPSGTPQILTEEDLKQLQEVATNVSANVDLEVESEAFQKLEEMVSTSVGTEPDPATDPREALTSLLQKSEGLGIFPSKETLVVLVETILVMILILTIVYRLNNLDKFPLALFLGSMAGQIGTAAIVYFASGVDFAAAKSPYPPPSQTQGVAVAPANGPPPGIAPALNRLPSARGGSIGQRSFRRKGHARR